MKTENNLPKALETDGNGKRIYRGIQRYSRTEIFSFWAAEEEYASEYGAVISATIKEDAKILDMIGILSENTIVTGAQLDELINGLSNAFSMDHDDECQLEDLWERIYDDYSEVVGLLSGAGYDGMRWIENGSHMNEAYLLIH